MNWKLFMVGTTTLLLLLPFSCITKKDTVKIKFHKNLTPSDFKIILTGINENNPIKDTIWDGEKKSSITPFYGENDWIITDSKGRKATFRHFKERNKDNHSYSFNFQIENNTIICHINIKGINPLNQQLILQ